MNFATLITDLRARGLTLQDIADKCGFASRGHVLDVERGEQQRLSWDVGDKLIRLSRRIKRRAAR